MAKNEFPIGGIFRPKTDYTDQIPLNKQERVALQQNTSKALDELHKKISGDYDKHIIKGKVKTFDTGYGLRIRDNDGNRIATAYKGEEVRIIGRQTDVKDSDGLTRNFLRVGVYDNRGKIDEKRSGWVAEDFVEVNQKHIDELLKNLKKKIDTKEQKPQGKIKIPLKKTPERITPNTRPISEELPSSSTTRPMGGGNPFENQKNIPDFTSTERKKSGETSSPEKQPPVKNELPGTTIHTKEEAKAAGEKLAHNMFNGALEQLRKDNKEEAQIPFGTAIPGRPGLVNSPYAEKYELVDVTGLSPGQEVECPYTGRHFRVPFSEFPERTTPQLEKVLPKPEKLDDFDKITEASLDTWKDKIDPKSGIEWLGTATDISPNLHINGKKVGALISLKVDGMTGSYIIDDDKIYNESTSGMFYISSKIKIEGGKIVKIQAKNIPKTEAPKTTPEKPSEIQIYRIKKGDTLKSIAESYGVDEKDIREHNRLGPTYTPKLGDEILIRIPANKPIDPGKPNGNPEKSAEVAKKSIEIYESIAKKINAAKTAVDAQYILEDMLINEKLSLEPKDCNAINLKLTNYTLIGPNDFGVQIGEKNPPSTSKPKEEPKPTATPDRTKTEAPKTTPEKPNEKKPEKTEVEKKAEEKIAVLSEFFENIDDKNLVNAGKQLMEFLRKMSQEEKEVFLQSTLHAKKLTKKDQVAFETIFGKQPADGNYSIVIDNRSEEQKAYLIDGKGRPMISFDISGGKEPGSSSPEGDFRILSEGEIMKGKVDANPRTKLLKKFGQAYKDQKENGMLDFNGNHAQMATAILALNTTDDYYLHGTSKEKNLGKRDSAGCIRFDNISIAFLDKVYENNGFHGGIKIIKNVGDKKAEGLWNLGYKLSDIEENRGKISTTDFLKNLRSWKDTPYKMGGKDKNGIDCSRLIFNSLKPIFGDFPGEICAQDIEKASTHINEKDAKVGDFITLHNKMGIATHIAVITSISPTIKVVEASLGHKRVLEGPMNYVSPIFYRNPYTNLQ